MVIPKQPSISSKIPKEAQDLRPGTWDPASHPLVPDHLEFWGEEDRCTLLVPTFEPGHPPASTSFSWQEGQNFPQVSREVAPTAMAWASPGL